MASLVIWLGESVGNNSTWNYFPFPSTLQTSVSRSGQNFELPQTVSPAQQKVRAQSFIVQPYDYNQFCLTISLDTSHLFQCETPDLRMR